VVSSPLRLYDTASRSTRDFRPLQEGRVGIYLCGATVQAPPHVGHVRSSVSFDLLRRWLIAQGYDVTFIRNVTDIDDKIIHNAGHEDVPYWVVAMRNERAFTRAYDTLGCLPATYEPRATGHIPEMISLMAELIDSGHGYAMNGDVYFDVRSYADYGSLSGQRIDDMLASPDSQAQAKRDPRDFAMWKGAKEGEPAWPTPWGPGRPGWHIECSAMARKYLGTAFDIHGGGLDLIFPHHENEIAQSCAAGDRCANFWVHNAWVTTAGEKMSKSLGNSLLVDEVVKRIRPIDLRFYLISAHYRSTLEYSDASVQEAAVAFRRIEGFLSRTFATEVNVDSSLRPVTFDAAMNDDLGVPQALAVLHEEVRSGNQAQADGRQEAAQRHGAAVLAMLDVLGLNPWAPTWETKGDDRQTQVIDSLISVVLDQRTQARQRKDYAAADRLRDELDTIGIRIEDTAEGVRWSLQ
jgi:cysteinyl-tRNA synthetase